jgi:hypothetical protein
VTVACGVNDDPITVLCCGLDTIDEFTLDITLKPSKMNAFFGSNTICVCDDSLECLSSIYRCFTLTQQIEIGAV